MTIDGLDQKLIDAWVEHQKKMPDAPADYLAQVEHLRIRMDEWERQDFGFRTIIGSRLADKALREAMSHE